MILLVAADEAADEFASVLSDRDVERVGPAAAADRVATTPVELVVVDRRSVGADADPLVKRLRSAEAERTVPLVVVSSGDVSGLGLLRFDEVVRPPIDGALGEAVERALTVAEYRDAVGDLYERCQAHAEGDAEPLAEGSGLRQTRDRADELLAELVDRDPGVLADLLWMPEGGDEAGNF